MLIGIYLTGTAWLSSARVVECSIYLLNGRNLLWNSQLISFLMKLVSYFIVIILLLNNFSLKRFYFNSFLNYESRYLLLFLAIGFWGS